MPVARSIRRRMRGLALPACLAVAIGCSSTAVVHEAPVGDTQVGVTPSAGATDVRPDAPVRVTVKRGRMVFASLSDATGAVVAGRYSADRSTWSSVGPLALATTYHVDVQAVDGDNRASVTDTEFRTVVPQHTLKARIAPLNGETVGVGMPIAVYFTAPVKDRAAVERRFTVTTDKAPAGAWHWYSDTEMHYRPPTYWPAHDRVSLSYDIRAIDAGGGVWGAEKRSITFTIGAAHVSKVDARTHTMAVYNDGTLVKTIAVSTGRDEFPTASGIHVVTNKNALQIMDSATIGIPRNSPHGYYLRVPDSVRISYSGEFVHAASWSVRDQGHRNVSHGCINVSPANAKWFFDLSRRGDIVDVAGTPRKLQQGNGYADWNLSWSSWVAGDALR